MMTMGSDEGSQPPDSIFLSDYSQDVWLDIDEICGPDDYTDLKDGLPHGLLPQNTYEEDLSGTCMGNAEFQSASDIAYSEFGPDTSGFFSGNDDAFDFLGNGYETFPFGFNVDVSEKEDNGTVFMGDGRGLPENSTDQAMGNERKNLHSLLLNDFHNLPNRGRVSDDAWPSVSDQNRVVSGSTFILDTPDEIDDQQHGMLSSEHKSVFPLHSIKAEDNLTTMKNEALHPDASSLFHHQNHSMLGSEHKSVFPLHSIKAEDNLTTMKNEALHPNDSLFYDQNHSILGSEHKSVLPLHSIKAEGNFQVIGNEVPHPKDFYSAKISYQGVQVNSSERIDDDSDLCILEDMSTPVFPNSLMMDLKLAPAPKVLPNLDNSHSLFSRPNTNDERAIFRLAMEDLSKPRSETDPPDGLLSVPLLKHQRIALSWMVSKETKGACCSGGILADDQGLGKTISTIALILKERPLTSKKSKTDECQGMSEMLDLEDDGVTVQNLHALGASQPCDAVQPLIHTPQSKGRPSGGTLIVCPTCVLRQWSDELQNKVTNKAGLSILVYYGSNRTKDPCELAMHDVVITTYSIVSMEVPKQPVVDEVTPQPGTLASEASQFRKRKSPETCRQGRKRSNDECTENKSGPLAKVGWFRVVLDEAQSIKNYRTKTARACWGLRAKRRWCLSGTPIQNSIDDLYSYFRFLRYEPFAVLRKFSEQLKFPIHRNPRNGYKKLQAVLKTVMLRRTKGSLIDGQPIINLPPKIVELRKIDFSQEERSFYNRLEVESQAEFAKFAESGTVKENYVNILLMLLRLRQACDHPLLVEGFRSNADLSSAVEKAKSLSQESQNFLLNCLEGSLAVCGICGDPPEDAAVTTCGHVFCNQCISEHILGNEAQCPSKKCKTYLTKQSVFSRAALHDALSDHPITENNANSSSADGSQVSNPHSFSSPEHSSKIRTAVNLLLSMSRKDSSTITTLAEGNNPRDPNQCDDSSDFNTDSMYCNTVQGGKAIVFSQWTRMLDLLEDCLKRSSIQYRRLDGTMTVAARDKAVKDFNKLPEVSVMIMSLKAASLGLNMVAACNVLLLDLWWNPTTEDQAIDRAHRIGQTRPVSVFRLTIKDTVEDRILALQDRKRKMVESAFGENERGGHNTRLTMEDLRYLIGS